MKIRIFQINLSRDTNRVAFLDVITNSGKSVVDPSIYDLVYEGDIETTKNSITEKLEDVFITFNVAKPTGYHARSLSVSEVVEICEHKGSKNKFYFCRNLGWKQISFDVSKAQTTGLIRVLMVEPDKKPYVTNIYPYEDDICRVLDCDVYQSIYPFEDPICLICDEEGMITGKVKNRVLYDSNGKPDLIVFGKFFICDASGERLASLSGELVRKYKKIFLYPESIYVNKTGIHVAKIKD